MYNGSNHFGRAYQEEMHRIAGVSDEHQSFPNSLMNLFSTCLFY